MDGSNTTQPRSISSIYAEIQYKCRILLDNVYHFRDPLTNKIKNVKLRRLGGGKYPICLRRVIIYAAYYLYSDLKYHTQRSRESVRAILIDSISIFGQVFFFFWFFTLVFRMKKTEAEGKRIISSLTFLLERQRCIDSDLNAVDFFFSSSSVFYVLVYIYI